jgi:hypothetical protein
MQDLRALVLNVAGDDSVLSTTGLVFFVTAWNEYNRRSPCYSPINAYRLPTGRQHDYYQIYPDARGSAADDQETKRYIVGHLTTFASEASGG